MSQDRKLKVAIAGTSQVAQYLIEELKAYGHEVVILTRREKAEETRFEQRETDYSVSSLVAALRDVDALVSTIADYLNPPVAIKVHLDMLEALRQSEKCKIFIPSEWTNNSEQYPDQPMFLAEHNEIMHSALKKEKNVKWTIIQVSWFMDYIVPKQYRYLRDVDALFPVDHNKKVFTIYGPGTQIVNLTSVRDVAKGVAVLLANGKPWEAYTYMSGQQVAWNELFNILTKRDPSWKSQSKSLTETVNQIANKDDPDGVFLGQFELQTYTGALEFPKDKVERDRSKYFQDVQFRTIEEFLNAADKAKPGQIL